MGTAIARRVPMIVSASLLLMVWAVFVLGRGNPVDALCYWLTDPAAPYGRLDYQFVYSPPAAQLMAPLLGLPFEAFTAVVRGAELLSLFALTGPAAIPALLLPPVATEVNAANINLLLALVLVLGFRWPALWTVVLLTKPSMAVGLLWFLVRGERRAFALAVAPAVAIATISFALAPNVWFDWIRLLASGTPSVGAWPFPYPVWLRLPIAAGLVMWGARTGHRWTVVAAATIALPRLYFLSPAMLVGMIPLVSGVGDALAGWLRCAGRLSVPTSGRGLVLEPVRIPATSGR